MGKLTRGTFTAKGGTEREQWTMLADAVVTSRSARPGGRPKPQPQATNGQPFNDRLSF